MEGRFRLGYYGLKKKRVIAPCNYHLAMVLWMLKSQDNATTIKKKN